MNGQQDIERTLDAWFVDGPSVMPDRLFDAVLDQVERTGGNRLQGSIVAGAGHRFARPRRR